MSLGLVRRLADGVRVVAVASTAAGTVAHGGVGFALWALVLLGVTLLRVSGAPPWLDLGTGALLVTAAWAALQDWYLELPWLDVVVHLAATGLLAGAAALALQRVGVLPPAALLRRPLLGTTVQVTALGTTMAVLWELGEWGGQSLVDPQIQTGYPDTMGDLLSGAVGAAVAGALLGLAARRRGG